MQRKIGTIFLATAIALAGIGVSYAGFFDEINVVAVVDVANVDLDLVCYSCTLLWKVWDYTILPTYDGLTYPAAEVAVYRGFNCDQAQVDIEALFSDLAIFDGSWEFESSAKAYDATPADTTDNEVKMAWNNIFPCTDFKADFIFHYDGSIPAKIALPTITWTVGGDIPVTFQAFAMNWDDANEDQIATCDELTEDYEITVWPIQVHRCNFIMIVVTIHLPQDNLLQGDGDDTTFEHEFEFTVKAIQWYDPSC